MIKYNSGSFGFALLFRLHGSAVFRSILPALISTGIYVTVMYTDDLEQDDERIFDSPYPMSVLIGALTFLLAFRANFSYNRYWEAFTAVYNMHSKWLDVGMDLAAFHLQSSKYDTSRPPAFGERPDLKCLERERERVNEPSMKELEQRIDDIMAQQHEAENNESPPRLSFRHQFRQFMNSNSLNKDNFLGTATRDLRGALHREEIEQQETSRKEHGQEAQEKKQRQQQAEAKKQRLQQKEEAKKQRQRQVEEAKKQRQQQIEEAKKQRQRQVEETKKQRQESEKEALQKIPYGVTAALHGVLKSSVGNKRRVQPNRMKAVVHIITTINNPTKRAWEDNQPPLLLQEGAHLLSLLSAVALSTLRNDLEEADSPLIAFTPGAPWPHVDPDAYGADIRKDWSQTTHKSFTILSYLFGMSRTPASRTLYNAARPFRVIGGVSDAEIEVLQAARGPYAKVALCTMWLQEFCSREHLQGGMGAVGAPIVSRLFQFISDGMLGYNQARKVAYIPFPFPHAQITSLFVLVVVGLMPILMLSYINDRIYGFVANLLTVMCFTGLHEVARELENPFQNVPNDIPLNNFQAQFNESLLQMFSGFHPDAYWEVHDKVVDASACHQTSYPPTQERLESINESTTTATTVPSIQERKHVFVETLADISEGFVSSEFSADFSTEFNEHNKEKTETQTATTTNSTTTTTTNVPPLPEWKLEFVETLADTSEEYSTSEF